MRKKKLEEARKNKQITQDELAFLCCMTQATYSRKERGKTLISMQEWEIITQILEVQLEEIYQDDKNNLPENTLEIDKPAYPKTNKKDLNYFRQENLKLKQKIQLLKNKLKD